MWFTFTVPATYIIGLISGIALCYCTLAICNGTVCFQVLWQLWCLQLIHCLYSCLWILVTCHDVTAIWLLGYFTRIMQYRVSTEFVHGWIAVLWRSHTQLQCERWHVVTTGHTHTVINILTLRLLMSYIYMERLFLMFLDNTQRRSTVGRTPLDEWSARRRDLYLKTHDTHNRQISMPPAGIEPKISAGERQDRSPAEILGWNLCSLHQSNENNHKGLHNVTSSLSRPTETWFHLFHSLEEKLEILSISYVWGDIVHIHGCLRKIMT